jgi:hypothetical protein
MKFPYYFFVLVVTLVSCNGKNPEKKSFEVNQVFAMLNDKEEFVIKQDTTLLKKYILENIRFSKVVSFNEVRIVKRKVIEINSNKKPKDYYYILLRDDSLKLKIGHWLERKGRNLYFMGLTKNEANYPTYYEICEGEGDCGPRIFDINGKFEWGCSSDPKCRATVPDPDNSKCESFQTIILDEEK